MTTNFNPLPEKLFYYGVWVILIGYIFMILTSCSVSRKANRDIEKSHLEETLNEKSTTNTTSTTNTRTTKQGDSLLSLPGSSTTGMKPLESIKRGDTLKVENDDVSAMVYTDQSGNVGVKAVSKPKTVKLKVNEVTETNKTEAKEEAKQAEKTREQDNVKKLIETDTKAKNNLPWLLLLLIPAVAVYVFRKHIPFVNKFFK